MQALYFIFLTFIDIFKNALLFFKTATDFLQIKLITYKINIYLTK